MRSVIQRVLLAALGLGGWALGQATSPMQPILASSPGLGMPHLLGAWQGGWLKAGDAAPRLPAGVYEARALRGQPRLLRGEKAVPFGPPCGNVYGVPLRKTRESQDLELLTLPKLNLRPRPVVSLSVLNTSARDTVRRELMARGLNNPVVRLVGVTRADLDGNGTDEVIIEATLFSERRDDLTPPQIGQPGDYSLLLINYLQGGKTVTAVLASHLAPMRRWTASSDPRMPVASLYRLVAIADLNGDGRMELVIYDAYSRGHSFTVSEWTPEGGEQIRLSAGCGT